MAKKRLFCADVESDGFLDVITKLHCLTVQELNPYMKEIGELTTIVKYGDMIPIMESPDNMLVFHNGYSFDGPAYEKVTGRKVKAEIIDTLLLSWYLYPKLRLHGLAFWGEEFGVPKPKIDDWEGLTLEEYIHRCEEDVKIQTMLWQKIWKDLEKLYGADNRAGIWHAVKHLNFKAKCAAMQEKARWKLNIPMAEKWQGIFSKKFSEAKDALEAEMPMIPIYTTATRPKKCFKLNKQISALGLKWGLLIQEKLEIESLEEAVKYTSDIKYRSGWKEPNAGGTQQLKDWLTSLGWVPESFKHVRNKETGEVRKVPQIKDQETKELCESIVRLIPTTPALKHLEEMSIVKHRLDITNGFLNNVDEEGYVQALIQGLTNTLRFKHKVCLNLPSVRKPYGEVIRGMLIASDEDHELCGSDMSSLEDRTKQHYMWPHDPNYVRDMQGEDFDPHLDMALEAKMISPASVIEYKKFNKETANAEEIERHVQQALVRHAGKSTNYAATYGAGAATIARSAGVDERVGHVLHKAYWTRNWSLKAIANEQVWKDSRGMKWLWNPVSKMWLFLKAEKDIFSTLNQSTGTYAFDRWVWYILSKRPQLTAQFHDEVVLELKKGNREKLTKLLKWAVAQVNIELKLNRDLDCDVDFGMNYAEIH